LSQQLQETDTTLRRDLAAVRSDYTEVKQMLDAQRFDAAERENRLKLQHAEELASERDRLSRERETVVKDVEMNKSAVVARYDQQLTQLTHDHGEVQRQHATLQSRSRHLEEELAALRRQYDQASSDSGYSKTELARLQAERQQLMDTKYALEKTVESLQKRSEGLESSVRDKQTVIGRLEDLVSSHQGQNTKLEEAITLYKRQQQQLENQLTATGQEISKANDIIQKLQNELKTLKSKLKLKNVVTVQQEKLLDEKQIALDLAHKEVSDLKEVIVKKESELGDLRRHCETLQHQVEQDKKMLDENHNGTLSLIGHSHWRHSH
jgi:spindle assembly abnormal protein 6